MNKQLSFVITAAIMLTAFVTVALYTGSQTAHAAFVVIEKAKHPGLAKLAIAAAAGNMTNATPAGANMTNATPAGANMTK
jgi:hypothetical protein